MATNSDSPLPMPAERFSTDQKPHRANNSALEQYSQVAGLSLVPIGGVLMYAGSAPPIGYLECNGDAISRTAYGALFSVIGTSYGVGDGSTTFNVPTRAQVESMFGLPAHVHTLAGTHTHGGVTTGAGTSATANAGNTGSATASGSGGIFIIRTGAV